MKRCYEGDCHAAIAASTSPSMAEDWIASPSMARNDEIKRMARNDGFAERCLASMILLSFFILPTQF